LVPEKYKAIQNRDELEFAFSTYIFHDDMFAPEEIIEKVRRDYDRAIAQVLSKERQEDIYSIMGAIEVLVGSKIRKGLPTSFGERMVFAFTWLAHEVQNGGFHQYFFNSAGDFWKDVSEGLKSIGDEKGAALFQEAISIFPESTPSTDRFARQEQLSELDEKDEDRTWGHFEEVTNQYFKTPFPNWEKVFGYIKAHSQEFGLENA
jgi:hypothetical protein